MAHGHMSEMSREICVFRSCPEFLSDDAPPSLRKTCASAAHAVALIKSRCKV